jgi:hypothetical protein
MISTEKLSLTPEQLLALPEEDATYELSMGKLFPNMNLCRQSASMLVFSLSCGESLRTGVPLLSVPSRDPLILDGQLS